MNFRLLCIGGLLSIQCTVHAATPKALVTHCDSMSVSIAELWQQAQARHLLLNAKEKEIDAARETLKQERLWDNPEVEISHNINNPVTKRYFETGKDGETDIQISQRIYIGGQRKQRIRKAEEDMRQTEYEHDDLKRLTRRDISRQMIELYSLRQKTSVIDKELSSVEQILRAYEEQEYKGNITKTEVLRIRSLHLQLKQEKAEIAASMTDLQHSLRLMAGLDNDVEIIPVVNYKENIATLAGASLNNIKAGLDSRADIMAGKHGILSAEHDVELQKANALPELSITGEWDKNGNIGHNFFAVGVSLSLPIFNRNQGNIKAARAALENKRMQQEWNVRQIYSETDATWKKLSANIRIANEAESCMDEDSKHLIEAAQQQFIRHNISILELLDYYQTYKDAHYLIIDSRKNVLDGMAEMDIEIK